jgi:predicted PurR-regulated permease PerM
MARREYSDTQRMDAGELIRRTAIITLTVLVILGLVLVLIQVHQILLWILVGIILAIALHPAVDWLAEHRVPRVAAALLVSLATIAALVGIFVAVASPVVLQADDFIRDLPAIVRSVFEPGGELRFFEERFHVVERLAAISPNDVANALLGSQDAIVSAVTRAASFLAATITILVIMVMLLIQGSRAWTAILGSMVGEERVWAARIGQDFLRAVGGYVRGNLAISVIAGLSSYVLLRILGIPYAETLAVMVAILDVIPLVGALIAMAIVTIVGFATGGATDGIILLVFFIAYQQFENNVLQNIVYSKTVALSPLVVFIAVLIGAGLGGIIGVLLAIPLASAAWTLGMDLVVLRQARHAAAADTDRRITATGPENGPEREPQAGEAASCPSPPGDAPGAEPETRRNSTSSS